MGMNVVRQLQGELIAKLGHCQNHIRPQGVKTGQHPRAYKNKSAPKPFQERTTTNRSRWLRHAASEPQSRTLRPRKRMYWPLAAFGGIWTEFRGPSRSPALIWSTAS
jgi:hypothetical protein